MRIFRLLIGSLALACASCAVIQAEPDYDVDYLSPGEAVLIGGSAITLAGVGELVKNSGVDKPPRWTRPPRFDRAFSRWIGGKPRPGYRNFMDPDHASLFSTVTAGSLVLTLDLAVPKEQTARDAVQGQFLFYSGALAQKGVHDIFKGLIGRQRPLACLYPQVNARNTMFGPGHDRQSFYSGHASSAFYAMTFLNKRARLAMRQRFTPDEWNSLNWLAPALSYGWAGFVALSRVQAYRHYLSDVVIAAIAGWLIGELFYSFGDRLDDPYRPSFAPPANLFQIQIPL